MPEIYTDDDIRVILTAEMAKAGGLVKWAKLNDIPISRVSEFHTGRRPASPTMLIALGFVRVNVRLADMPVKTEAADGNGDS